MTRKKSPPLPSLTGMMITAEVVARNETSEKADDTNNGKRNGEKINTSVSSKREVLFPNPAVSASSNGSSFRDEKAAIRDAILVQGSGFRREKQEIVAAMGYSPALLLSPSADVELQRKLHAFNSSSRSDNNNDDTSSFSGVPDGSDPLEALQSMEVQQHQWNRNDATPWSNAVEPTSCYDELMPETLEADGIDEYALSQSEIKRKRFRRYLIIGGVISLLVIAAVVGVTVGLTQAQAAGAARDSSGASGEGCTLNLDKNDCIVPHCARIKYEELQVMYMLPDYDFGSSDHDEDCDVDHRAANALAIRWTNTHNDDAGLEDINDYFAMASLYFSLGGEKWRNAENWLNSSSPACEWYGVKCTKDKDGRKDLVLSISLPDNFVRGSISTQVGLLTSLRSLNLRSNSLAGTMPSEIGRLVNLETLDLFDTKLMGQFPSEIAFCSKLAMLDVGATEITGTFPTEIGNLAEALGKKILPRICFLFDM